MKGRFFTLISLLILFTPVFSFASGFYPATALTGGGTGALDKMDGADLSNGDVAIVVLENDGTYGNALLVYVLDSDSGASESSPSVISPDTNAGTKRWELTGSVGISQSISRSATPQINFGDSDCSDSDDNVRVYVNCTDTGSGTEDCDITIAVQIAGVLTDIITVDADGNVNIVNLSFTVGGTAALLSGGALGTPSSGTGTNLTGIPISTGLTGAGTGVLAALAVNIGSAGAPVLYNGAGGQPSSIDLTNANANTLPSSAITTIVDSAFWDSGGMTPDGTQCADAAEATINSGPMQYTIICADNDASTLYGHIVMPDSWDAGTVTFELEYLQTAADTNALNSDITCQCRGATETVNNTWGTEQAIDDAGVTGSNAVDHTTSAAVTCNGTCAAGDTLYWRWQMDATGTTTAVATLHILGIKMEYTSNVGD